MTPFARTVALGGSFLVALATMAWWLARGPAPAAPGTSAAPQALPAPASSNEPCERVLRCAAGRALAQASEQCRPAIEQLAAFQPRWAQRAGEPIFTDFAWLDAKRGTLTYFGRQAEFQNATGAFTPVAYECDWDPAAGRVLDARVKGAAPT